ncbi:MAG TPA: hypothetical protein VJ046_00365, partial [Candidatus Paceibacterota bacterium]|nr:hypothetical protein [Candidatus Paceibacterota bacterium]
AALNSTLSVVSNLTVDTNTFYVDATNNRVGIGTTSPETTFELIGIASISGDVNIGGTLTALGNIGIGTTSAPNELTVIGSGSFTGQLKATRNPTQAHTGTWPSFTNLNDSTLYINPSSPVADGNVIAYVSGSDPKFLVDAEGDIYGNNLILQGSTSTGTTTIAGDLSVEGNSTFGDASTDKIKFRAPILPYSLSSIPLVVKASASQTEDVFRVRDANDNILLTIDQGTGLLTASSGFNFALGGSTATVSYSRLGTATTGHGLNEKDDLLISGLLEVDSNVFFDSKASISSNLQISGRFIADIAASHSFTGDLTISKEFVSSGTASNSFAGSLLVSKGLNAQAIVGTGLTINGNANITGNSTFDTDTLYIDSTNNRVGILTTTPSTVFEVQGTASASYLLTGNTLQVGGFASAAYSRFGTDITTHSGTISGTSDLLVSGGFEVNGSAAFDGLTLFARGASFSGNITPTLDATFDIGASSSNNLFRWRNGYFSNQVQIGSGTLTINTASISASGILELQTKTANPIQFTTNNSATPAVVITSAGNLGIGTTAPNATLHVISTLQLGPIGSGNGFINSAESIYLNIDSNNDAADTQLFQIGKNSAGTGGTALLTVQESGNVGIGTTGPDTPLHVYQAGGNFITMQVNTQPTTNKWAFRLRAAEQPDGMFGIYDVTAAANRLVINSTGNVGIGTTDPLDVLHVVGDIRTSACASDGAGDVACVDVAETFPVSDNVSAGDIVGVDTNFQPTASTSFAVKRSAGDARVIGVVSTAPAILIEGNQARFGGPKVAGTYTPGDKAPVALVGRVPVKVSDENGAVAAGDRLTASKTLPGYAMKQTEAGISIGVALEAFGFSETKVEPSEQSQGSTLKTGKVLVFVNLGYWLPDPSILAQNEGNIGTNTYNISTIASGLMTWFKDSLHIVFEDGLLKVANIITENITASFGTFTKVKTQELCVDDICVTREQFKAVFDGNAGQTTEPTPTPEPEFQPEADEPTAQTTSDVGATTPEDPPEAGTGGQASDVTESTPETTPEPSPEPNESPTPTPEPSPTPVETEPISE